MLKFSANLIKVIGFNAVLPITVDAINIMITKPSESEVFYEGDTIEVKYEFNLPVPNVTSVELWVDGVLSDTQVPPFGSFYVSGLLEGAHVFEVKAYDINGVVANSTPVHVSVLEALQVGITSPAAGQDFIEGDIIAVDFQFNRADSRITKVELLSNGIVVDSNLSSPFNATLVATAQIGTQTLEVRAYAATEILASDSISVEVIAQLVLTIDTPAPAQEYDEGQNIVVSFSFNRQAPEVSKTELWVNGTLAQTDSTPPFPASFVIENATVGAKALEVKAYDVNGELASDTVNVEVKAVAPAYDQATIDYLTALAIPDDGAASGYAALTNHDLWQAVDTRVTSLKAQGLWSKIPAIYPLLGTTAAQKSFNLKNPAMYQLTWMGGWTFTLNSVKGNGTNTYAKTGMILSSVVSTASNGMTVVVAENNATGGVDGGAYTTSGLAMDFNSSGQVKVNLNSAAVSGTGSKNIGIATGSRLATVSSVYLTGAKLNSATGSGSVPAAEMYFGAFNTGTGPTSYSSKTYNSFMLHEGLTDTEVTNMHAIIDTFETTLGRKTW